MISRLFNLHPHTMQVKKIAGALGAELSDVDLRQPLSPAQAEEIRTALLDHQVIFLRKQNLTPQQFLNFANAMGEPIDYPFLKGLPDYPQIIEVKKLEHETSNFGGIWHSDTTYLQVPPMGSMLLSREVPPYGGDTMFANQYIAHDSLSPGMQKLLEGVKAEHSSAMVNGGETARSAAVSRSHAPQARDRAFSASPQQTVETVYHTTEHPVVRIHPETGRKALYINRGFVTRFADMTPEESQPLLDYLWAHASQPEFTCRYHWTTNDVGVWDNRCTLHFALNDYYGHRRELHRISVHEPTRP